MTKWFKPGEKLPEHEERVLIRIVDRIETAFYDSTTGTFNLRNGAAIGKAENISWMALQVNSKV